jgi:hypothetical protein
MTNFKPFEKERAIRDLKGKSRITNYDPALEMILEYIRI